MLGLNRRTVIIMRYLLNTGQLISSEVLASVLGTTSKTVRNDIDIINAILNNVGAYVNSKSGSGYSIVITDTREFMIFIDNFNDKYNDYSALPPYNEERIRFIMHSLLLQEDYIKSEWFADTLFISRVTLTKDLRYVRALLEGKHLHLQQRPNHGLKVIGEEAYLRIALLDYLYLDEDKALITTNDVSLTLDMKECMDTVSSKLLKYNVHVSFQSLHDIAKLISLNEYRLKNHFGVIFTETQTDEIKELEEYGIVNEIYDSLHMTCVESEVVFVALFIAARRLYRKHDPFPLKDNKSLFFLCDEMLKFLFIHTDMNFLNDDDLRLQLTRELRGFLLRVRYKFEYQNLEIMNIKCISPAFDYAMLMADYLNKKYGYEIPESEIAELTLLLHQSISKHNMHYSKQRICLIFNYGYLSSYSIMNNLQRFLTQYIESVDTREYYELREDIDNSYDLIITDIPKVKFKCTVPIYRILNKFGQGELNTIKKLLMHKEEEFALFIKGFHEDLFFYDLETDTKEKTMDFLIEAITSKLQLSSSFRQAVEVKESISSGEYGNNVFLSHSLYPVCKHTCIAVALLKKSIIWKRESTQLVFLIAMGYNENFTFMSSSLLNDIIHNIFAVHALLKTQSLEQFSKVLYQYLVQENDVL